MMCFAQEVNRCWDWYMARALTTIPKAVRHFAESACKWPFK